MKVKITKNAEKKGIELRFDEKPDKSARERMKEKGWRWAFKAKCWYIKETAEAMAFAKQLKEDLEDSTEVDKILKEEGDKMVPWNIAKKDLEE